MDVVLHIGAHLCATSTFQDYLSRNHAALSAAGCAVWGPRRTRSALFAGLLAGGAPPPSGAVERAIGRIGLTLARQSGEGTRHLIVTDPDIMGTVRANLRLGRLYCGVGERIARLARAFDGYPLRVVLNIRVLDAYWASALAQGITRGLGLPAGQGLAHLAQGRSGWREVVEAVACAMPGAQVTVLPFESFGGSPEAQLQQMVPFSVPAQHTRCRINATPRLPELRAWLGREAVALPEGSGRWQPFSEAQGEALREAYSDDIMWLAGGANGLARLARDPDKTQAGTAPPQSDLTRGRRDEQQDRRLAGTG